MERYGKGFLLLAFFIALLLWGFHSTTVHTPPEVDDRIERLNEELERPDHPLRKTANSLLGIDPDGPPAFLKRKVCALFAKDPNGIKVEVQWDELRYKPWGGYFVEQSRTGVLHLDRTDDLWNVMSFQPDSPLVPITLEESNAVSSPADVFVRRWNRTSKKFEEFDESVQPKFVPENRCVVIVHGMGESTETVWITVMGERIAAIENETNILAVDWSRYSKSGSSAAWWNLTLPMSTANKIPYVSEKAGGFLFGDDGLRLPPEQTHLIGFSHGAHVSGIIGQNKHGKLKRLTILDPSTRKVHWSSKNRFGEGWSVDSAQFIDMYRTSGWAGMGNARGYRVFYVLEKGRDLHATFSTYADHLYAPKWFASTIGQDQKGFGYSISTDAAGIPNGNTGWSGLIVSTLPKPGDREGLDTATSILVPFPQNGSTGDWTKDSTMYKELLRVTDIVVKDKKIVMSPEKTVYPVGDSLELRLYLENNFKRARYFETGVWGFAAAGKIPGHAWISDTEILDTEKTIPLSTAGILSSTDLKFRLVDEKENSAQAVASVRLPNRKTLDEKFGRSNGEFYLHIEIGGVWDDAKSIFDLNEDDNFGVAKIRIE